MIYGRDIDTRSFYERATNGDFVLHNGVVIDASCDRKVFYTYHNGWSLKRNTETEVGQWRRLYMWYSPKRKWCLTDHFTGETLGGYATREVLEGNIWCIARDFGDKRDTEYMDYLDAMHADMAGVRKLCADTKKMPKRIKGNTLIKNGYLDRINGYPEPYDPQIRYPE